LSVGTPSDTTNAACPSATATNCSLRQLILYVEANPSPPDTIIVPSGSYVLNSALLVTGSMTIVGSGARATTIEETPPTNRSTSGDRVFDVQAPSGGAAPTVALEAMEMAGGDANAANGYYGGDIISSGVLTLSDDWVTNGFACSGGGVSNAGGTLTIERSLISANQSACESGGDDSGRIQNYGVPGTPDLPGVLVVADSTIADNAARLGAAIFSSNDATNTVVVTNSTIADNTEQAEGDEPVRSSDGGGLAIATGTAKVENTILAGNTSTASGVAAASNCSAGGLVTSLGNNLEDADTCAFSGSGDLSNTNPELGALADNGGPTDTFALTPGSPAIGHTPPSGCTDTDQRGVPRPPTANCDIGAFELTTGATALVDPTASSVDCSYSRIAVVGSTVCTARVTDTASTGYTAPTGTVTFSSTPYPGIFSNSGTCTLSATGAGTASCTALFSPERTGSYSLTVTYEGDGLHQSSTSPGVGLNVVPGPPPPPASASGGGGKAEYGYGVASQVIGDTADVRLSCKQSTACNLTLTLSVGEKLQGGRLVAITAVAGRAKRTKTVHRTVVVGSAKVTVAAGKHRTVKVRLNATGRRFVARHRLKTKLTIREKGSHTTHTAGITFKAPKPVKKKPKRS
jgi:hypothetical protein